MKRLDFEETNNKKRALLLSIVIHGLLVSYIAYTGYKMVSTTGGDITEIDFLAQPNKGSQQEKMQAQTGLNNAKEQVKARRANTKAKPKPKPKPQKLEVEDKKGDLAIGAAKVKKAKKAPKKDIPTELPAKENQAIDKELAELAKEDSIQQGPNKIDTGNDKLDVKEETAKYGDPNAVRSHEELTPIAGNRQPSYPADARRARYAPLVVIDYYVKPDGRVRDIRFIQASKMQSINRNIINAVSTWRFRPGLTGYFRQEFQFRLNKPAEIEPELLKRRN